jgi:chromosome segregation ATPase
MKCEQQEEQLRHLSDQNTELSGANQGFKMDNQKLIDENRLLKKAVGIQETRYKESNTQNRLLRDYLSQAAEQISKLERANSQLRSQLQRTNCPGPMFSDMPPDIY